MGRAPVRKAGEKPRQEVELGQILIEQGFSEWYLFREGANIWKSLPRQTRHYRGHSEREDYWSP